VEESISKAGTTLRPAPTAFVRRHLVTLRRIRCNTAPIGLVYLASQNIPEIFVPGVVLCTESVYTLFMGG
jgi:hypothetical protein